MKSMRKIRTEREAAARADGPGRKARTHFGGHRPVARSRSRGAGLAIAGWVLTCLAYAPPSSAQLTSGESPSFRVMQVPKRDIRVNEMIDLGTLKGLEVASHEFLLVGGGSSLSSGSSATRVALSVDSPAVQVHPSEVTLRPGDRIPFEIEVSCPQLARGTNVFEVSVRDLGDPGVERPFRIKVAALKGNEIENVLSALYERNREYTVGSGKALNIELSQFETIRRPQLANYGALDLATPPGGLTLEYEHSYLGASREGERIVVSPSWRDAGDLSETEWMRSLGSLTFLESIEPSRHTWATRYQVAVSLEGVSRTYSGLALWGGGGDLQVFDYVIQELSSVATFQPQPGRSSTLLADTIEEEALAQSAASAGSASQWTPESLAAPAGVRVCKPHTISDQEGFTLLTADDHWLPHGVPVSEHGSSGWASKTCFCTSDCQNTCNANIFGVSCRELGPTFSFLHKKAVKPLVKKLGGPNPGDPDRCIVGFHCGVTYCERDTQCVARSMGIELNGTIPTGAGGGGALDFSHGGQGRLEFDFEKEWSESCPPCLELHSATLQVVADPVNGNPFQNGDSVTVALSVDGEDTISQSFSQATPLHNFGRFAEGLSYGITAVGDNCMRCDLSLAPPTGTIQGPLNFLLTCRRPDSSLAAPGGAEGSIGAASSQCSGAYPVTVEASAQTVYGPPDIDMPTVTATLSASPLADQSITIDGEGSHSFPNPLPDGSSYAVTFGAPPNLWTCATSNSSGQIVGGPAAVDYFCFYAPQPSDDCSQNPTACVAPPDCSYVWNHIGNLIVTFHIPQAETILEVRKTYPVYQRSLVCNHLGETQTAGSSGGDRAPLVILRNWIESEFPGPTVPITGLARDDSSEVTDVKVFVNGQRVTLAGFEFNRPDFHTCSEIPVLEPGRPCNYLSRFSGLLDVSGLGAGEHQIGIYATNAAGLVGYTETVLNIAQAEPNALVVTDQPHSASVYAGESVSWSVAAGGGVPPYSYTWEAMGPQATIFEPVGNCCNSSGSATPTLSISEVLAEWHGSRVRCRIEDAVGDAVVSRVAGLTVGEALQFAAYPQDVTVAAGEDASFSVDVFGGEPPYSYQWQALHPALSTFVDKPGSVEPTLTLESVSASDDGWAYRCRVTDSAGTAVYSPRAFVTVEGP